MGHGRHATASAAVRSVGSRIRHTSERRCVHGRSSQSWANMPASRTNWGQLMRVTDEHRLAFCGGGGRQKFAQIVGADHGGLMTTMIVSSLYGGLAVSGGRFCGTGTWRRRLWEGASWGADTSEPRTEW